MFELVRDNHKVEWEDLGEGFGGDYTGEKDDVALLRFSCYERIGTKWEPMEDASYCTRLPVGSPEKWLHNASESILTVLERSSYKRGLEELSWYSPSDFS